MERHSFEQPEQTPRKITELDQLEKDMTIVLCHRLSGERRRARIEHIFHDSENRDRHSLLVHYLSGEKEGETEQIELDDWGVPEPVFASGFGGDGWIERDPNQGVVTDPDENMSAEFAMPHDREREYPRYEAIYSRRPKLIKGQISSPEQIAEGDYVDLFNNDNSVFFNRAVNMRVVVGPERDPDGDYYIRVVDSGNDYDKEGQLIYLSRYGVVPYGNGEWEKKMYMKKGKRKS